MKTLRLFLVVSSLALVLWNCKKATPVGSYKFDQEASLKTAEAEVAKMPEKERGMAKFGLALFKMMKITLHLKDGGVVEMETSMPSFTKKGETNTKKEAGTWKQDGSKVTFEVENDKKKKTEMSCELSGSQLVCKKARSTFYFNKA